MASVVGYTAAKINELLANGIVNAEVDSSNHLILTTRDGTVVDAGPVGGNTTIVGRQIGETIFWLAPLSSPVPVGFLALEGGTASRGTYADLWALWGTTYGAGDGVNTFGLPDMRGKGPFGYDSAQTEFNAIGKTGGEKAHALVASEMEHKHEVPFGATSNAGGGASYFPHNATPFGMASVQTTYPNYDNAGSAVGSSLALYNQMASPVRTLSAAPHQNMPPYLVGRWLVKALYTGAEVNPRLNALLAYPVGAIYMSVNNTDPGTLFGGTWSYWGTGRMPVAVDTAQAEFNTVEKTGGEKTHLLTAAESGLREHTHLLRLGTPGTSTGSTNDLPARISGAATSTDPAFRTGQVTDATFQGGNSMGVYGNAAKGDTPATSAHNNLPPYITCYMWKRTA